MSSEQTEELRRFLRDRRARISPAEAGLPHTPRRRVAGLRREEVAALAGIGVSWYTALENGDAARVSEATLHAVAEALRLSESERQYLTALAGRPGTAAHDVAPDRLAVDTMNAIAFPAYIITSTWDVVDYNEVFRRVWEIEEKEMPFNAVERLFMHPSARKMHGSNFAENITPVIAMLRSSQGRQPHSQTLRQLCDRLIADNVVRGIWNDYEIRSPLLPNTCTIESAIGTFRYETLTLPISGAPHGIVVQVPDKASRKRLAATKRA
jgi:transcriptional regulator with XRE-family HTH domain